MLECGNNFKGSQSQICRSCNMLDDEPHRLNYCTRFRESNYYDDDVKIDFQLAFSTDIHILRDSIQFNSYISVDMVKVQVKRKCTIRQVTLG